MQRGGRWKGVGVVVAEALLSSKSNEWATPRSLFDVLNAEFAFTLDAAASDENAKCERYFTREDDALVQSWAGHRVFLNPPYGREIGPFMAKAYSESWSALVVCVVPARVDTAWWWGAVHSAGGIQTLAVRYCRGRVAFDDPVGATRWAAPFPVAVVVLGDPFHPGVMWNTVCGYERWSVSWSAEREWCPVQSYDVTAKTVYELSGPPGAPYYMGRAL